MGLTAVTRRPFQNGVDVLLEDGTRIEIRWQMSDPYEDLRIHVAEGSQIKTTGVFVCKKDGVCNP